MSGLSTPISLLNNSAPSSPPGSFDDLLELDKVDQVLHRHDDLQSRLELAERREEEALFILHETQHKLEALGAKHEELVEASQSFRQWRDGKRLEWAAVQAKFDKRHLEEKVIRKTLEAKCSTAALDLGHVQERHSEAQEEIKRLNDQISALLSSASTAIPDVQQDPHVSESHQSSRYDQCLTLSVQGSLFRVSRRLLERDSQYFEELLESNQSLGNGQAGMTDAHPIILEGVQVEEMHEFLTFLYEPPFQTSFDHITIHQWAAILKLATLWSFNATRAYAISLFDTKFTDEDCFNRLERAFACAVPKWVRPAYDAICRRPQSLSANEGRRLGWDRYAAICRIREDLARGTLRVPRGCHEYLMDFSEHSATLFVADIPEHPNLKGPVIQATYTEEPTESSVATEHSHKWDEAPAVITPDAASEESIPGTPRSPVAVHASSVGVPAEYEHGRFHTIPDKEQVGAPVFVDLPPAMPETAKRTLSPSPSSTPVISRPDRGKGSIDRKVGGSDWREYALPAEECIHASESEHAARVRSPKVERASMSIPYQPGHERDMSSSGSSREAFEFRQEATRQPPSPLHPPAFDPLSKPSHPGRPTAAKDVEKPGWGGRFRGWDESPSEEPAQPSPPAGRKTLFNKNRALVEHIPMPVSPQLGHQRGVPSLGRPGEMFSSINGRGHQRERLVQPTSLATQAPLFNRKSGKVERSPLPESPRMDHQKYLRPVRGSGGPFSGQDNHVSPTLVAEPTQSIELHRPPSPPPRTSSLNPTRRALSPLPSLKLSSPVRPPSSIAQSVAVPTTDNPEGKKGKRGVINIARVPEPSESEPVPTKYLSSLTRGGRFAAIWMTEEVIHAPAPEDLA
ncbi:hypothetical protein FRB96_007749 [Tulasnella sp. 330]|nr:hypothetical protein FRB96_007749 [Tulasnella sp. 330]